MKKIISLLIAITMMMVLCSCCLQHSWVDATCTEPKTCSKCGKTEGDPMGHTQGDWEVIKGATMEAEGERAKKCTRCGEILETETVPVIGKGTINITPAEFKESFAKNADGLTVTDGTENGSYCIYVRDNNSTTICTIYFAVDGGSTLISDKNSLGYDAIAMNIEAGQLTNFFLVLYPIVATTDPSLTDSENLDTIKNILSVITSVGKEYLKTNTAQNDGVFVDEILYMFNVSDSSMMLSIMPR